MIFENLFTQNVILETAMQATEYKNKVIMNNIANVDTPKYKSKTVRFEGALAKAINKTKKTGENHHMNEVMNNIFISTKNDSTTLDENSIDIETEMINFYKNSTKYDAIVNSVLSNSNVIGTVYSVFK